MAPILPRGVRVSILPPRALPRGPGAALHNPAATGNGAVGPRLCEALRSMPLGVLWGEVENVMPGLLETVKGLRVDTSFFDLYVPRLWSPVHMPLILAPCLKAFFLVF